MAGRESEYHRGYANGVAAMVNLITSDKVVTLDKTNVLRYAKELVQIEQEREANAPYNY
jgi:hypothetical protein